MRATLTRQAGLSLIELMIAITIGLFLLVGLVSVFATSNQTYLDLSRAAQQIENGRFAVQVLSDDIAHAGFYGRYSQPGTLPPGPGLPDPCVKTVTIPPLPAPPAPQLSTLQLAMALPIQGYDGPTLATLPADLSVCLPDANHLAGTDVLVIRRADSTMSTGDAAHGLATDPAATLTAGNIYLQANADSGVAPVIAVATGNQANDETPPLFSLKNKDPGPPLIFAPVRRYHVHIYFVAPCSVPADGTSVCVNDGTDDNGAPIPTLKRIELTSTGVMSVIPLVEGIENFQVDYGIDTDKDGVPDGAYITAPTLANFADVVAVRISVLARNIQPSSGPADTKSYDMGVMGFVTPGGAYRRHVYNAVIRVVNPASRRES